MTDTLPVPDAPNRTRLPPHDPDAEQALVGAMLLGWPDLAQRVRDAGLSSDDFYSPGLALIYQAACEVADELDGHADPLTVAAHLDGRRQLQAAGGSSALTAAQAHAAGRWAIDFLAATVIDCHRRRQLITAARELAYACHDNDRPAIDRALADLRQHAHCQNGDS